MIYIVLNLKGSCIMSKIEVGKKTLTVILAVIIAVASVAGNLLGRPDLGTEVAKQIQPLADMMLNQTETIEQLNETISTQHDVILQLEDAVLSQNLTIGKLQTIISQQSDLNKQLDALIKEQNEQIVQLKQTIADLNATLQIEVGSTLYGLAGDFSYMIAHPYGDTELTAMKDGATGAWKWWSINASSIGNAAYGNLSLTGGTVFWKAGDYPISPQINHSNNTITSGEGKATRLYLPDNQPQVSVQRRIFWIGNCENVTIRDLCVDGNYLQNTNITSIVWEGSVVVWNSRHIEIVNCDLINGRHFAVNVISRFDSDNPNVYDVNIRESRMIENKWNGMQYYTSGGEIHDSMVEGCYVSGSCDIALATFGAAAYTTHPRSITFKNNKLHCDGVGGYGSGGGGDGWYGIRFENANNSMADGNTIDGKSFYGITDGDAAGGCDSLTIINNNVFNSSYSGINIENASSCIIRGNTVVTASGGRGITIVGTSYNLVTENVIVTNYNGINEYSGAVGNVYALNNLQNCTTKFSLSGTNGIVRDNIGFITEAWGSNTTAADGGYQAFTLAAAPTYLTVSCGNSTTTLYGWYSPTATTFRYLLKTIALASATGQTVTWYVKHNPYA